MKRIRTRWGELDCTVYEPAETKARTQLVLCHGYGAPGTDLVSIASALVEARPALASTTRFVFPEAPLSLDALGAYGGRAWWHLDVEALLGQRDWSQWELSVPEGLARARRQLMATLQALHQQTGIGPSRTVLGGFSQGAMLTADLALRMEESPAGLFILSGTLLARADWLDRAKRRAQLPVLQSHGRQDAILPFSQAERLRAMLTEAGMNVSWVPFDGPHTIWPDAIDRMATTLEALDE